MNDPSFPVVLQECASYDRSVIAALVDQMAGCLRLSGTLRGSVVLLKPNLISSGPPLACTHSEFIAGVAGWFLDQGARVVVGDSPAFGSAEKVCHSLCIDEVLKGMKVPIVNFLTPRRVRLAGGASVTVAREALDCDLLVGLPKITAHNQMFVTLAVKNLFGIVKGVNKAMLHMVQGDCHDRFAGIILDLLPLLPPQVHLVDGIEAMHKTGPLDGSPLALHCMAAARCPVALDTALIELLELDRQRSPLWRVAWQRKLPGSDPRNIAYPQLLPEHFHPSGFLAPASLNGIRFNPLRFLRGLAKRAVLRVGG